MACAMTIQQYLSDHGVSYDEMRHEVAPTSLGTATACGLAPDRLAKAVMLADEQGATLMAVIPASHQLRLKRLSALTGRRLHMVPEQEFAPMFGDCLPGAIPPVGMAYGIETVWDESLGELKDMYLEAGDHRTVLHVSASDFVGMMGNAAHGKFSRHM